MIPKGLTWCHFSNERMPKKRFYKTKPVTTVCQPKNSPRDKKQTWNWDGTSAKRVVSKTSSPSPRQIVYVQVYQETPESRWQVHLWLNVGPLRYLQPLQHQCNGGWKHSGEATQTHFFLNFNIVGKCANRKAEENFWVSDVSSDSMFTFCRGKEKRFALSDVSPNQRFAFLCDTTVSFCLNRECSCPGTENQFDLSKNLCY